MRESIERRDPILNDADTPLGMLAQLFRDNKALSLKRHIVLHVLTRFQKFGCE